MHFKPDFLRSRTFWTAIITAIGEVGGTILIPETMAVVNGYLQYLMPLVLIILGVTERAGAAPVVTTP